MRTRIDADVRADRVRAGQLLKFSLARIAPSIAVVRISLGRLEDPRGATLTRCSTEVITRYGERVHVEETQATLEMAVTRALERSLRLIQRRAVAAQHLRSA